jgi:hypothetical protein
MSVELSAFVPAQFKHLGDPQTAIPRLGNPRRLPAHNPRPYSPKRVPASREEKNEEGTYWLSPRELPAFRIVCAAVKIRAAD